MNPILHRKLRATRHSAILPCYGKEYGRSPACSSCEHAAYCRNARDLKPRTHTQFEKIEYAEEYADCSSARRRGRPRRDMARVFVFIEKMNELRKNQPRAYKMLVAKVTNPELSLAQIAAEHNCDKQLCHYHLKKIAKAYPEFKNVILFDKRFRPRKNK